jgi:hypothetical protein
MAQIPLLETLEINKLDVLRNYLHKVQNFI